MPRSLFRLVVLCVGLLASCSSTHRAPVAPALAPADFHTVSARNEDSLVSASPKPGWGDFPIVEEPAPRPWWQKALLWLPNRVMDIVDIFRVDVGVGPAFGAVARITKYGQVGYRSIAPGSLRVGDFGRRSPVMVETSSEFGIGPAFIQSKDRSICYGEFGVGLELFLAGGYLGFCGEEVFDFIGGILFLDPSDDDIQ